MYQTKSKEVKKANANKAKQVKVQVDDKGQQLKVRQTRIKSQYSTTAISKELAGDLNRIGKEMKESKVINSARKNEMIPAKHSSSVQDQRFSVFNHQKEYGQHEVGPKPIRHAIQSK